MLPYHLCLAAEREERGELSSIMESGVAFTFQSRKRWRTLLFVYPYKIIIEEFVHIHRHPRKKEIILWSSGFAFTSRENSRTPKMFVPHFL